MKKIIKFRPIIILMLLVLSSLVIVGELGQNQKPQLGSLGYPSKEEVTRFYKHNKKTLEYIRQSTFEIDSSFEIFIYDMEYNYTFAVRWKDMGENREANVVLKERNQLKEKFAWKSKLVKLANQLFDSDWISGIYGRYYKNESGEKAREILFANYYGKLKHRYQVGLIYLEDTSETAIRKYEESQEYKDNQIDGHWYYYCLYFPEELAQYDKVRDLIKCKVLHLVQILSSHLEMILKEL